MRAINYINRSLVVALIIVCLGVLALALIGNRELNTEAPLAEDAAELRNGFEMPKASYAAIAGPPFELRSSAPAIGLPDLRDELILFGIDGRPDADPQFPTVYLSFKGSNTTSPVKTGERRYILFDRSSSAEHYSFSQDNLPTNLWIVPTLQGEKLSVEVSMCSHEGEPISSPEIHSRLILSSAESKATSRTWSLGKWKVDGSLMARLRARWFGEDLFLALHGGKEFVHLKGKHRIDFGENDESYSCFLSPGDVLIWKDERWKDVAPGDESRNYPLLHVKKLTIN